MIRISMFGGLSVRDESGRRMAGAAAQPRRMAILALLACAGERGVTREKILALLWPDAEDERGPRTLAQALYALRKDLGSEEAIAGAKELRLDPAIVSCDVSEFASAIARGDDERAVTLYHGPFLDGFHVTGSAEFGRWVETERSSLAQEHARALESLARGAQARGDPLTAVTWWRKLAGLEPLNARVTVGLMESLAAAGDRAGAIKHAHVYELLVEQELDLPPDKQVMALAERLRQSAGESAIAVNATAQAKSEASLVTATPIVSVAASETDPSTPAPQPSRSSAAAPAAVAPETRPSLGDDQRARPRTLRNRVASLAVVGAIAFAVGLIALRDRRASAERRLGVHGEVPVVAIGHIVAFGDDSAHASMAAPVADLLATSLGRSHGIRVVSQGRMLELMLLAGSTRDTSAGAFINAARRAGAGEVIDGTLYGLPGGGLRLDLRRVHLATGAIDDVQSVEGSDLFALVDSGTVRLVAALGTDAPVGSVTEVTTRSLSAYRSYDECVRAFYRAEFRAALAFCDDALATDSLFALAAYFGALAASKAVPDSWPARMDRARTLATRAPDRERLIITADWAFRTSSPMLRPVAETLAARYPSEVEGYYYSGIARVYDGEFLAAIPALERVVAMDSSGLQGVRPLCWACEAMRWWVSAYVLSDSLRQAERVARDGLRLQPGSWPAAIALIEVLDLSGLAAEAESTARVLAPAEQRYDDMLILQAEHLLRIGNYDAADRLLLGQIQRGGSEREPNALWDFALSLRERGRMAEALDVARRLRRFPDPALPRGRPGAGNVLEAQLLLEAGRAANAAVLFDSISHTYAPSSAPSQLARHGAWMSTHAATARRDAGDTATLARLADSVRALGASSGFARDQRLYHHVRALLLSARGRDAEAIAEFRAAIYSVTSGYTRTNLELARVLLRVGSAREAVAVLQPALRGPLQASNLYVIRTELHEVLARAWDALGVSDSAAAHYAVVARTWSAGDATFKARAGSAQARVSALRN